MQKSLKRSALVAALCLATLSSGCYGPFNLTKKLHNWNGHVDGKWGNEGMFLVLVIIPVYGVCMLGDAIIFNSVEFWTGNNPISPTMADVPAQGEMDQVAAVVGLPYSVAATQAPGLAR
ncbi:MAG TPA: DUF3332 family protein [Planctomycetota bacterium]|nr:DUF3332 family protein [Planctomycetota bacterium]